CTRRRQSVHDGKDEDANRCTAANTRRRQSVHDGEHSQVVLYRESTLQVAVLKFSKDY
ncbi:hypothetical protein L195_g061040, partial [Trifolium pratense]